MATHLFVYGSLAFADVWTNVVRGRYRSEPAHLDGYRRFAIRGKTYPGIVGPAAGGGVPGRVYRDVDHDDLERLDRFEGDDYRRIEVTITVPDSGERLSACTYLYLPADRCAAHDWDAAAFERDALAEFLQRYPPPRDG